jgi:hypothetical protein
LSKIFRLHFQALKQMAKFRKRKVWVVFSQVAEVQAVAPQAQASQMPMAASEEFPPQIYPALAMA